MKLEWTVNGRKVASGQFARELSRAAEARVEEIVRKAAGPGVRLRKTRDGLEAKGTAEQIARLRRRLGRTRP